MSIMTRNARKSSQTARPPELVVSLCISISHQPYMVTPIKAEDPDVIKAWRLEKKGADGAVYDVAVTIHGFDCSCPDFEVRRKGLDAGGCKHCKALVKVGLLAAPIAPAEAAARIACTPARVEDAGDVQTVHNPAEGLHPAESPADAMLLNAPLAQPDHYPDEAPELDPADVETARCVCGDCQADVETLLELEDLADVWELGEGPTEDPDADVWALGPDANSDDMPPQPTDEDLAEFHAFKLESAAREHLDQSATLKLDALAEHVGAFFRTWGNDAGDLFARTLEELAVKIRLTEAATPADFVARLDVLEADCRRQWEDIGYENGREFARHELLPAGPGYGHMA